MSASPDLSRRRTPSATAVLGLCPPSGGGAGAGGGGGAGSGGGSSRGGGCGDAGLDGEDAAMKYPARGLGGKWAVPLEDERRENTKAAANSGEKLAGAAAAQVVWLPPFLHFLDGGVGGLIPACLPFPFGVFGFGLSLLLSLFVSGLLLLMLSLSAFHFGLR